MIVHLEDVGDLQLDAPGRGVRPTELQPAAPLRQAQVVDLIVRVVTVGVADTRQVAADLRQFFAEKVFTTIIPRSIRLAEAPSFGKPILGYDPRSKGAESYIQLAKEVLDHEQARKPAQGAW